MMKIKGAKFMKKFLLILFAVLTIMCFSACDSAPVVEKYYLDTSGNLIAEFEEDKAITELFDVTTSYMTNRQVMVVKNDKVATYPSLASLKTARFAVEQYSKAETLIKGALKTAILG